ncbi:hypothetical protein KC878_00180 [Candidatus Saccharibacteria bacterium]|nr:hypothetical protein [Candidatus Saccharibacteria bacterium]MCB9821700.1 hypothetical protein [Candidatus Nomurabacteria bacterium]
MAAELPVEIEGKWLIENDLWRQQRVLRVVNIFQGYLKPDSSGMARRIRYSHTAGDESMRSCQWLQTAKGERVNGQATEVETDITRIEFEELWPQTEGSRVSKSRYYLDLEAAGKIRAKEVIVDIFQGDLLGLVMAEIEVANLEDLQMLREQPPVWCGLDVTDIKGYSNAQLACNGLPSSA